MWVLWTWRRKDFDRVNREALWQVLKMYDVGGKLLNGIKSTYVNILACVRVKGGESECFRIKSGVRQGCIISPWLFNVYFEVVEVKIWMGRKSVRFEERRVEIAWPLVCR